MSRIAAIFFVYWTLTVISGGGVLAQSTQNSSTKTEAQKKAESKGKPLTVDKLDPSFFEAKNQRECDRPRACGCNCEDAPPPSKNQ